MNRKAMTQPKTIREQIAGLVTAITPLDELERTHQAEVLEWVHSGANLFRTAKPDKPAKHLVSYFVLYDPSTKTVLLADHINAGLWLPTGGHVEVNEHPQTTVIRECKEELKTQAKFAQNTPLFITATQTVNTDRPHTDVSLWYVLKGQKGMSLDWDKREFKTVKWWDIDAIKQGHTQSFDPHMRRFVEKLEVLAV